MFLLFENDIVDNARKHKGHILIRKQHCLTCNRILAIEITNKLGSRGEYWVVMDCLRTKLGTDLLYGKKVWFGNIITCPNCGRRGKLPIDKPLSAENIANKPKEVLNATPKNIS